MSINVTDTLASTAGAWDELARQTRLVATLAQQVIDQLAPHTSNDEAARLVEQSRELADFAERTRETVVASSPLTPEALAVLRSAHAELDAATRQAVSLAADCRRATFQALKEQRGMPVEEIAAAFGVGQEAVYKVLRERRPKKPADK